MAKIEKEQQSENNGHNITELSQLRDNITIYGKPVFKSLEIDNETGNISYTLNEAIESELNKTSNDILKAEETGERIGLLQMEGAPQKIIEIIEGIIKSNPDYETLKEWQEMFEAFYSRAKDGQTLLDEMRELRPYIDAELEKTNYKAFKKKPYHEVNEEGQEISSFKALAGNYTLGELLDMLDDPDSDLSNLMKTARKARETALAKILKMQEGKSKRQAKRDFAEKSGALMYIPGGNLSFFSSKEYENAFTTDAIDIMAGIGETEITNPRTGKVTKIIDIDPSTGLVNPDAVELKTLTKPAAAQIPYNELGLFTSILLTQALNMEEPLKTSKITFHVDGVLRQITDDPRVIYGRQRTLLNDKDPGEQYLEALIGSFHGYIGKIGQSRYSIIAFDSYDAEADAITVNMPYIFQLYKIHQRRLEKRQKEIENKEKENRQKYKAITAADYTPFEKNDLFRLSAFTANAATLQIAVYITNKMLQAGSGKDKKINPTFKTIIAECPLIKERLEELEKLPRKEKTEKGKIINNQARYNGELKKIASAIELILNPDKCKATEYYNIKSIEPSKNGKFLAPTKSRLDEKLIIKWDTKKRD